MKRCTRCVLPETFPGIEFDEEGVCNYCRRFRGEEHLARQKARLKARFEKILAKVRGQGDYDCLMSWSGGKDSTYTMMVLKQQYDLRILAFTFDQGFVSETAQRNMRVVAENLGVDLLVVKPRFDLLRRIFVASTARDMYPRKALERASNICTSCMGLAKGIALRLAIEKGIPIIAYGWSPGQAPLSSSLFKTNPTMIRAMMQSTVEPLRRVVGNEIRPYFLEEHHFAAGDRFPYNISPLAFLEYNEEALLPQIQALGWQRPEDTDPNSTNCLLNAFGIQVHKQQWGFHPYAWELANLVREGYMSREEALARLEEPPHPEMVAYVQRRLGVRG